MFIFIISYARQVIAWLEAVAPNLADLTPEMVRDHRSQLQSQFAGWTVFQHLTKMRLLLDQAVELGMIPSNPARQVPLNQPKVVDPRRILTDTEIRELLEISLRHRHWINGGLPTVVRLGLYAGLRNEEMCWRNNEHFRKAYLVPALTSGLLEMSIPDKPNGRLQHTGSPDRAAPGWRHSKDGVVHELTQHPHRRRHPLPGPVGRRCPRAASRRPRACGAQPDAS